MTDRTISWNTPYTFSGKEKDVETGYGYFGARYYDSGLSIWLSVDPMSDKYPHQTNYVYCSNKPLIIVDPDGKDEYWFDLKTGELTFTKNNNLYDIVYFGSKNVDKDGKILNANVKLNKKNKDEKTFTFTRTLVDTKDWYGRPVKDKPVYIFKFGAESNATNFYLTLKDMGQFEYSLQIFQWVGSAKQYWVSTGLEKLYEPGSTYFYNYVEKNQSYDGSLLILFRSRHNHPSGNYNASNGDKSFKKAMSPHSVETPIFSVDTKNKKPRSY